MTVYKGKVTAEFIARRDRQVSEDSRDKDVALRQWDFEFVEHHQCSIPSGHILYEGYEYDTEHEFFGKCDFKHVNRFNAFHLSQYIRKQLHVGLIDHIVLWKFKKHPGNWQRPLEVGDSVQYEVLDYIPREEILTALLKKNPVRGFTINT